MSITTFRLAREQEEARLKAEAEKVEAVKEEPVAAAEPIKAPAPAPKAKTATVKN